MENDSFRFDSELPHLNAAVGQNWAGSNEYGYMIGFGQAVDVLLATAVNETYFDPYTEEQKSVYIDALVYPICYCARHFVELFLKRQIRAVSALKTGVAAKIDVTHDLMGLWEELKKHLAIDVRLRELGTPLEEYIKDVAAIDASSETFRYWQDTDGNMHLQSQDHINLHVLGGRFKKMMALAESFDACVEPLRLEYAQRTTTDGLSRAQIREIGERLPPYATWSDGALVPVKQKILQELGISSNAFCRALSIIKNHREFAALIGLERPLENLSIDVFARLKAIADERAELTVIFDDEWVRLEAIVEIGRLYSYCEEYDSWVTYFSGPDRESPMDRGHIKRAVLARNDRFRTGLRKLGQITLLSAFDTIFAREAPAAANVKKDLRELFQQQLKHMTKKGED
jgi:hypothetical protein